MNKQRVKQVKDGIKKDSVEVIDASIPSKLHIVVTDTHGNIRTSPTYMSLKVKSVPKGTKLSFDEIVIGEMLLQSREWYQLENGYIHSSQVKEVNEVN